MNVSYKVREWLHRAFTEQADRINESYFFDRLANEFYSVFITDYFLTDPNSTDDFQNSPYSQEELAILSARIDRQESNDQSIISVPRLTIDERKEMMQSFLDKNHVHDTAIRNLVNAENGRTNLDFNNLLSADLKEKWQEFKWYFVQVKVERFCNLENINLEAVTLWTDKKITTWILNVTEKTEDLTKETNQEVVSIAKPWWKFW